MDKNIENVINGIDSHMSRDLIIYELYTSLAKFFERDLKYFLATDEEKYAQYQKGFINRGKYIVCSTLADFYVKVFNDFGIPAKKTVANSAKIPLFVVLVLGERGWYYLDPLNDLFYNQYNVRPVNFGVVPRFKTINANHPELVRLPKEYLFDLEKSLNIKPINSLIDDLHEKLAPRNVAYQFLDVNVGDYLTLTKEKLDFMATHLINLGHVNGPYERVLLYLYLYTNLLDNSEKRKINVLLNKNDLANVFVNVRLDTKDGYIMYAEEHFDDKYRLQRVL